MREEFEAEIKKLHEKIDTLAIKVDEFRERIQSRFLGVDKIYIGDIEVDTHKLLYLIMDYLNITIENKGNVIVKKKERGIKENKS